MHKSDSDNGKGCYEKNKITQTPKVGDQQGPLANSCALWSALFHQTGVVSPSHTGAPERGCYTLALRVCSASWTYRQEEDKKLPPGTPRAGEQVCNPLRY